MSEAEYLPPITADAVMGLEVGSLKKRESTKSGDLPTSNLPLGQYALDYGRFIHREEGKEPFYHVFGGTNQNPFNFLVHPEATLPLNSLEFATGDNIGFGFIRTDDAEGTIDIPLERGGITAAVAAVRPVRHPLTGERQIFNIHRGMLKEESFAALKIDPDALVWNIGFMFNGNLTLPNILNILHHCANQAGPGYKLWYDAWIGKTDSKPGDFPKATGIKIESGLIEGYPMASRPNGYVFAHVNAGEITSTEGKTIAKILEENPRYIKYKGDKGKALFPTPNLAPDMDEVKEAYHRGNARALFLPNGNMGVSMVSARKFVGLMLSEEPVKTQTYRGAIGVQVFKMK